MPVVMPIHTYTLCDPKDQGQRLDRWLAAQVPSLSRSQLQKLIEQGQIRLNDQVCLSKKQTLQVGDTLHIQVPEPEPSELQPEEIPLDVLYEDDALIIVNKPAGMVVHPSAGHTRGTLVHALLAHCRSSSGTQLSGIGGVLRPGIVHRLDKDTTGAIAVAKTDLAHQRIQAQIQAKTAQREYLGIVFGHPKTNSGTINQPIGRHPGGREKMTIVPEAQGGRQAITQWRIQERLGNLTLLYFRLQTGRTHQIRVHCAAMGWPIVGDPLYSRGRSIGVNLTGQALHAWRLCLQHPISHALIQVEAPLPPEFVKLLRLLRQRNNPTMA